MRIYRLLTAKREVIENIRAGKKTSIAYYIKAKTPRFLKLGYKVRITSLDTQESILVQITEKHRIKNKVLQDGLSDHLILCFKLEKS